jgi:signal peptidase I
MNIKKSTVRALRFLVLCLVVMYLMFGYRYRVTYNLGESMHPTYYDGEWIYVQKRKNLPRNWTPSQLDVIVVKGDGDTLIKRVIGIAGDTIAIQHGRIILNGEIYKDPYTNQNITFWLEDEETRIKKPRKEWLFLNADTKEEAIPEGFIWVIGDNRHLSWYGLVKIKDIKGLVVF